MGFSFCTLLYTQKPAQKRSIQAYTIYAIVGGGDVIISGKNRNSGALAKKAQTRADTNRFGIGYFDTGVHTETVFE